MARSNDRSQGPASEARWLVPLSDLVVDDEIRAAVAETVDSGWWSMGPRVEEFETAFATFCGTRHAIAVTNGTAALHLALLAVGCGAGDDVVLPSLNFVAAANAVAHTGATPVFCDIAGAHDLNLDPAELEAAAEGRPVKASLVLHYAGFPADMDAITDVARRRGFVLIEDAAHAPGASWRGRACGAIGRIGCFSFFANKNLPVGEGGMVVTDDDELAARIRLLRSHGMTTLTWDRHRGHAHSYDVVARGLNYRLDEVGAAIGLVQLRRLGRANAARARLVDRYRRALDGVEGIQMPFGDLEAHAVSAHHLAVVVLPLEAARDTVREKLADRGIQTSVHYPPIHRFSEYAVHSARPLPRTDEVADRLLTLPLYPHLADEQVDLVAAALLEAVRAARSVSTAQV
jgi:dTDP-4-amino-4,6-dideoxygalactose transaminase